jgi:hypothetical protein
MLTTDPTASPSLGDQITSISTGINQLAAALAFFALAVTITLIVIATKDK